MVDTKTPAKSAPAKAAPKIVAIDLDDDDAATLGKGNTTPSPLLEDVKLALDNPGKARAIGYGEDYPKSTVLEHIYKARNQLQIPDTLKLRTFKRDDYVGKDGKPFPHVAFKFVPVAPAKAKADDTK